MVRSSDCAPVSAGAGTRRWRHHPRSSPALVSGGDDKAARALRRAICRTPVSLYLLVKGSLNLTKDLTRNCLTVRNPSIEI
ncbi:hypothetical protein EVAR_21036_1 [Eumeta japonica]|uniref:Uncharacterized protein n=1 Tax=Eumeta variegata TaxID=151549 RepID=A0A4C1UZS0_EUMVA|nr:hypothetical protein EVAR_21036_1 [Eumeta japonica]